MQPVIKFILSSIQIEKFVEGSLVYEETSEQHIVLKEQCYGCVPDVLYVFIWQK